MRNTKKKMGYLILLILISASVFQIYNINTIENSTEAINQGKIHNSALVTNTRQWIKNGNFSSQQYWNSTKGTLGDPEDVRASISGGYANYEVLGKNGTFSLTESPIDGSKWTAVPNPDFPHGPTTNFSDSEGLKVYHLFEDIDANQNPSVHWDRNFTMPVNMSDYVITSASIQGEVNATVNQDVDCPGDTEATEGGGNLNQQESYDYVRFYFLISDLFKDKVYEIAYLQPTDLGQGDPYPTPGDDTLPNTYLIPVPEDVLIFYITSVLSTDYSEFTVTLGIRIYTADNYNNYDIDEFHELLIKSVNLNFTYERIIDQQTSVSWNQEGDKPIDIITNPFEINEAILNFKYKINDTWPQTLSPNSEIIILINNNPYSETIKLSTATTSLQNASLNGFDLTPLIDKNKNINITIQVYLADKFRLNQIINISIDDIYLNVTYTETVPDILTNLQLFLNGIDKTDDPVISLPLGEELNITVKYTNKTGEHIPGALVQLEGKVTDNLTQDPTFDQYSININTSQLGIGVKILAITAQKSLYETNQTQFFIEVTERESELLLYLNGNPKSEGDTFNVKVDETVNITVYFQDNKTHQHLPDATVTLLGWGQLNETNNQYYNITINTNDLNRGINAFTIFAQLVNYTTNSINFFIEVFERATQYELFLNNIDSTLNPFISLKIFETLNITVKYLDNETGNHIINASLQYIGGGLTGNLTEYETLEFYSEIINTTDLGIGVSILNVIAQKTLYETQNIQFFVEVTKRETELSLFLNGEPKNDGDKIILEVDEAINVTVYYRDNITKGHLPGATVTLLGFDDLDEMTTYYNITINTNDLDQGITILTIVAQLDNYQSISIQFLVEIIERDTELILFLNGIQKNDGDTIQVEINDLINITIYYRDNKTKNHLSNATVELVGRDNLDETNNYYNITINALDLEQGITILTIFAQLANYQPQSIQFFIKIIERSTNIQLFINNEDKTLDPTFSLTIGQSLNITVKYTDNQTGNHINTAVLQLIGEGILINLTRDDILGQHYIILDTTDLGIGVKLFSILAQATNFQIKTIDPRITVNRIYAIIDLESGVSQIEANVGDDILLQIVLNNTVFGGLILDATVTYKWSYGQGELLDPDNNGIFEAILENVPVGVHTITITAFAGDNFDFQTKEITLVVTRPETEAGPDLSWVIYVLIGAIVGLTAVFTLYQIHFKYPPMVRKIRKLRKKIRKDKKTKPILTGSREQIIQGKLQNQIDEIENQPKQLEDNLLTDKETNFKGENDQNLKEDEM